MIECISISIYDTTLPQVSEENILDFAEKGSIHWIYDGGDNKFLTMMASRLEFDMEVPINESLDVLVYDYLFTGNETRYSVVMRDQDENVLWRGFLIPEEYVEPYDKGTFFIHFTATDGLGRLKGKMLPYSFYRARQSVIKVIADCLKETGLSLPINLSTSIVNDVARGNWEYMYVDAQQWYTDEKKENCYDILQGILQEVGATLFQQNEQWYIVGWNYRGVSEIPLRKYTFDGIAIDNETITLPAQTLNWYATPSLNIKPAFREVAVQLPKSDLEILLPENVVEQDYIINEVISTTPVINPLFWKSTNLTLLLYTLNKSEFPEYLGEPLNVVWNPGFEDEFGAQAFPANLNYYMSLNNPKYVLGGLLLNIYLTIKALIGSHNPEVPLGNDVIMYDITIDGVVVMSNKPGWPKREMYKLEIDFPNTSVESVATGILDIQEFEVPFSGYLDVKIYYGGVYNANSPAAIFVDRLNISFKREKYRFSKRRAIDFTKTNEITVFNSDSVIALENKAFVYQIPFSASDLEQIPFANPHYDTRGYWVVDLAYTNYLKLLAGSAKIYVKRENSDFYEWIEEKQFFGFLTTRSLRIVFPDNYLIRNNDSLYVHKTYAGNPQTELSILAREQWQKTTNGNGVDRLGNVLAEVCHDLYPSPIVAMEGDVKGLVQPVSLLQFELKNQMRNFIPIRIDITPNENQTSVTLVEYKNEKITDYGG